MPVDRSLDNNVSNRVLNLLEPIVWKVVIEKITVVKFRINSEDGNGAGCFEVKIWTNTTKFTTW